MPTDPLTGSRYPAASAAPNVAQDIQNAVMDLADNTIPSYATAAARDLAYNNWVSAGNAMRNGLFCYVTGTGLMEYTSGSWRRVTGTRGTASFTTDASGLGLIPHGLGATPTTAQVTPVYQNDGTSGIISLMRGALTNTNIQVVCYRMDSTANPFVITRLESTLVQVDWEAWL